MPQRKPVVQEYSAERRHRLQQAGLRSANGNTDSASLALLTAIEETRAEIAELRSDLESVKMGGSGGADGSREGLEVRIEIAQMVRIITSAKQEIAAIKHPMSTDDRMLAATSELDAIVLATETSTNAVLSSAEAIENLVRTLSSRFQDDEDMMAMTEQVANEIIKIFEACNFQDITGQRMTKVVKIIKFIEERILSMIEIWGLEAFAELPVHKPDSNDGDMALMNGPQLSGGGISQDDINALFD
jgi:chemotaxis protein CheZ